MKKKFNYKEYLLENKLTVASKELKEGVTYETKGVSYSDALTIEEELKAAGLERGKDYKAHVGRGDDVPNAYTPLSKEAFEVINRYGEGEYED